MNIGSWLMGIEAPITAVPEPSTYELLAMAGADAAGYMLRAQAALTVPCARVPSVFVFYSLLSLKGCSNFTL